MAGNIVPTIASTNAIVAAIQVTEAIKFLQAQFLAQKNQPNTHIKNKELYVQNTRTTKVLEASLGKENPSVNINKIQSSHQSPSAWSAMIISCHIWCSPTLKIL